MRATCLIVLLVLLFNSSNAQKDNLYKNQICLNLGALAPTLTINGLKNSPISFFYKASFINSLNLHKAYSFGLQMSTIANFKEISIPFFVNYRSIPKEVIIPGTYVLKIPMNVEFGAGASVGYVDGEVDDSIDIKLNRNFISSLILSARFCYLVRHLSFYINPELRFLLTKNYSFCGDKGWKNPLTYFGGSFGLGYSF